MLRGLRIQNFKGIDGAIDIPIKPVTLLYGVNSAGKSSILHSLHFIRGVLEHHDLDPSGSPYASDDIDLGGFLNLLHKHDIGRRMVLGYHLDLSETDLPEYGATVAMSVSEKLSAAYVEFGFSANDQDRTPSLDYYIVSLNGEDVALVMPDSVQIAGGTTRAAHINLRHPLLQSAAQTEEPDALVPMVPLDLRKLIPRSQAEDLAEPEPEGETRAEIEKLVELRKKERLEEFEEQSRHVDLLTYQVTGFRNGLPSWGKLITSPAFDVAAGEEEEEEDGDDAILELTPRVLTELIVGPLEVLRDLLVDSRAIGPLRSIPVRRLNLDARTEEVDWYGGLAAWYRLHECPTAQLAEVNNWLYEPERLGTGYALERVESREVPQALLDAMHATQPSDWASVLAQMDALPIARRVWLVDTKNGVKVTPHDVGVGLSQLIPVLVVSVDRQGSLLLVEQPELHIHPRVQVGLGDLFLQAARKYRRNFLIETHSEAMLLRMMKRIRQTQDGELPKGVPAADSDDVEICLIQNEGKGVTVTQMRMNDRGEFVKPWPKGLFEESLRETF